MQDAMVLKVALRFEPTRLNAAIAATAINAAISAYSIAVTPASFLSRMAKSEPNGILLDCGIPAQTAAKFSNKCKRLLGPVPAYWTAFRGRDEGERMRAAECRRVRAGAHALHVRD